MEFVANCVAQADPFLQFFADNPKMQHCMKSIFGLVMNGGTPPAGQNFSSKLRTAVELLNTVSGFLPLWPPPKRIHYYKLYPKKIKRVWAFCNTYIICCV